MSSTAPIPDVAEVLIRSEVNGKAVELCQFYHSWQGPINTTRLTTLANRVSSSWSFNFRDVLASNVLFKEVLVIDRSPAPIAPVSIVENSLGGFGGEACSTNIALGIVNVHAQIDVPAYSQVYIYAIPESKVNDGTINLTYANNLLGLYGTNGQSHSPFGWHHVVVSLYQGGSPRAEGVWERATSYRLARLNPAAQRRRLTGR